MMRSNIDWHSIPLEDRQKMLERANLLDKKGRPKRKLTGRIKMMVIDQYYDGPRKGSNVVTK